MPLDTDLNEIIDRMMRLYAKSVPLSFENLRESLRRRAARLDIGEAMLCQRIRERAARLDVWLVG
jgi:hypothetical protein